MQGYIKDYRKELDSDIWMMSPLYHRVWTYLKYKANYKEGKIPLKDGTFITILPGQHLTSTRKIASGVAYYEKKQLIVPTAKTIRDILKWMVKRQMITTEHGRKGNEYTLITILNWSNYQSEEPVVENERGVTGNTKETAKSQSSQGIQDIEAVTSNSNDEKGTKHLTDCKTPVRSNTAETPKSLIDQGISHENYVIGNTSETARKHLLPINKKEKNNKELLNTNTTTDVQELASFDDDFGLLYGQEPDEKDLLVAHFNQQVGRLTPVSADYCVAAELLDTMQLDHAKQLVDVSIKKIKERKGSQVRINSLGYLAPVMKELYDVYLAREAARRNNVVQLTPRSQAINEDSEAYELAKLLLNEIRKVQPDFSQPDMTVWAASFANMLVDGKEPKRIQEAILFARSEPFWMTRVLNPDKLAKYYDTLQQQIATSKQANRQPRNNQRRAPEPSWLTEDGQTGTKNTPDSAMQETKAKIARLMAERKKQRAESEAAYGGGY